VAARQWHHRDGVQALWVRQSGGDGGPRHQRSSQLLRLPERYAGVKREAGTFPVQYLGANVPQAWAAGSVFHLLRALLGLDADAQQKKLYIHPVLPRWLPEITVHKLRVGKARINLRFWRDGEATRHEVLAVEGELDVEQRRTVGLRVG
jgi:hypothetical protein